MLIFERVLEVFDDYLKCKQEIEVVITKRGYTVLLWETNRKQYESVRLCETPEELKDLFLAYYEIYLELNITLGKRDTLEPYEQEFIHNEIEIIVEQLQQ